MTNFFIGMAWTSLCASIAIRIIGPENAAEGMLIWYGVSVLNVVLARWYERREEDARRD